ncbi:MAG: ABC-three component system middle component 6 [Chitinophagaceae bacterium]
MILPQDIAPEKSLYVMGARIIDILRKEPHDTVDPKKVYDVYNTLHLENITYNYFLYAFDWLYILNIIELTENNRLKKCF